MGSGVGLQGLGIGAGFSVGALLGRALTHFIFPYWA